VNFSLVLLGTTSEMKAVTNCQGATSQLLDCKIVSCVLNSCFHIQKQAKVILISDIVTSVGKVTCGQRLAY